MILFYKGLHEAALLNKNGFTKKAWGYYTRMGVLSNNGVTKQKWGTEVGIEEGSLGSIYCSLLENGRCSKTELIYNPNSRKETCFKVISFECKTTRVIEF